MICRFALLPLLLSFSPALAAAPGWHQSLPVPRLRAKPLITSVKARPKARSGQISRPTGSPPGRTMVPPISCKLETASCSSSEPAGIWLGCWAGRVFVPVPHGGRPGVYILAGAGCVDRGPRGGRLGATARGDGELSGDETARPVAGPVPRRNPTNDFGLRSFYFEHRNEDGSSAGHGLEYARGLAMVRAARGVTIAVADTGVELTHPEFTNRAVGGPHFNFVTGTDECRTRWQECLVRARPPRWPAWRWRRPTTSSAWRGAAPAAPTGQLGDFRHRAARWASDEQFDGHVSIQFPTASACRTTVGAMAAWGQFNLTLLEQIGLSNARHPGPQRARRHHGPVRRQ